MFVDQVRALPHGVGAAFTDRLGGVSEAPYDSLNLGRTDLDDPGRVQANFALLRKALGVDRIVTIAQTHGVDVWHVTEPDLAGWRDGSELGDSLAGRPALTRADAMVTTAAGVALCVRVADCLPVLLADESARVVGVAHAGRIGLLAGVLPAAVSAMRDLGAARITAWIGPHICGGCYEVSSEMAEAARGVLPATACTTRWGTPAIDLAAGATAQLADLGCALASVGACTYETPTLFSYRRDHETGRQAGLIWLSD